MDEELSSLSLCVLTVMRIRKTHHIVFAVSCNRIMSHRFYILPEVCNKNFKQKFYFVFSGIYQSF
jgi:hypothetical protein